MKSTVLGQALPGLGIEPQIGFALVACDHFEVVSGQFAVMCQQLRVATAVGSSTVEGLVEARPRFLVRLRADQTDHLAVDQVHALQPLEGQVTTQETGCAGEQHGADLTGRARQARRGGQRRGVDELVESQIGRMDFGGVAPVHRG